MVLSGRPTGTVTVTLTPSDTSVATVAPKTLTFTADDWTPKTVAVTVVTNGVADPEGFRSMTVAHAASGGGYDGVTVPAVNVRVDDDDNPGHADTPGVTTVPAYSALVPKDANGHPILAEGDTFRVLLQTARNAIPRPNRAANSANIADLDRLVRNGVGTNADLAAYKNLFKVLGSTPTVDARDHTGTTGTGEPIYWFNGDKVADDYADFYDGTWDANTNTSPRDQDGNVPPHACPWTGSQADGTKSHRPFGSQDFLTYGCLALSGGIANSHPTTYLYGLSSVLRVGAAPTPTVSVPSQVIPGATVPITVTAGAGGTYDICREITDTILGRQTRVAFALRVQMGSDGTYAGTDSSISAQEFPLQRSFSWLLTRPPPEAGRANCNDIVARSGPLSVVAPAVTPAPADISLRETSPGEPGHAGAYTVVLSGQPTGTVTVTLTPSDTSVATVAPKTLTFTADDWAPKTVAVTGVSNGVADPEGFRTMTVAHAVSGGGYDGVTAPAVNVRVDDDDNPGHADVPPTVSDASQFTEHLARVGAAFRLTLPAADAGSGNQGPYGYTLRHRGTDTTFNATVINGLRFDPATRILSGTPEAPGVWPLEYQVHDGDTNRAKSDSFIAGTGLQVKVTPAAVPAPTVTAAANALNVAWDAVPGVRCAVVNWTAGPDDTPSRSECLDPTQTSYDISGLTAATEYSVHVTMRFDGGFGDVNSEAATGTPFQPVADLTVTPAPAGNALDVAWSATASATEYVVQWKSGDASYSAGERQATVSGTRHAIPELVAGTAYTVRVTAGDGTPGSILARGESTATPILAIVPDVNWIPAETALELRWGEVERAESYSVMWKHGDEEYDPSRSASMVTSSHTIDGLTTDTAYKVRVEANDASAVLLARTEVDATPRDAKLDIVLSTDAVTVCEDATHSSCPGESNTYVVRLNRQPEGKVTVKVLEHSRRLSVSPKTLTFTASDWSTEQTVTVTGRKDDIAWGTDGQTVRIRHMRSGGGRKTGISRQKVTATVHDDDTASVIVDTDPSTPGAQTALTVAENGTAYYTIAITSQPRSREYVQVASRVWVGEGETARRVYSNTPGVPAVVSGGTYSNISRFTADNWRTPRTVTVRGVKDNRAAGSRTATVRHETGAGSYYGKPVADVDLTVTDTETVFLRTRYANKLFPPGARREFFMWLQPRPDANVTLTLASSNPLAAVVDMDPETEGDQKSITFTPQNHFHMQRARVRGVGDGTPTYDGTATISVAAVTSSDADYHELAGTLVATLRVCAGAHYTGGTTGQCPGGPDASPNESREEEQTFSLNGPPIFADEAEDQAAQVGMAFSYVVPEAEDAEGDAIAYTAALDDGGPLPDWLAFDAETRTLSGTPGTEDALAVLEIEVTAADDAEPVPASSSTTFTLTVAAADGSLPDKPPPDGASAAEGQADDGILPNRAPAFGTAAEGQAATTGEAFSYTVPEATDPEGGVLTYTATLADGNALPAWLSFDPATRELSGTPGAGDAPANLSVEVTATDDGEPARAATASFSLTVTIAVVADAGPDLKASPGDTVTLGAQPGDGADAWAHAWTRTSGPPVALGDADKPQATFTVPADAAHGTAYAFELTVTDARGKTATDAATVTVNRPASACHTDLGPLAVGGSEARETEWWDNPACRAHHRADRPARYFRFTLTERAEVSVDVTTEASAAMFVSRGTPQNSWGSPAKAGLEHRLKVRQANGKLVHEETLSASLVLVPATYTVEAVLDADGADAWRVPSFDLAVSAAQAPVAVSVADALAHEAAGAMLSFAVTLDWPAPARAQVSWATSDGTAVAGEDYRADSGTLVFAAGESTKTIKVAVLDDAHDEGEETMTLTLSNPSPSWVTLADATATGTIMNADQMPRGWIARLGRTVADQALGAVHGRMSADRSPGFRGRIAGEALPAGTGTGAAGAEADGGRTRGHARDGTGADAEGTDPRAVPDFTEAERLAFRALLALGSKGQDRDGDGERTRAVARDDVLLGSSFALARETGAAFWGRAARSTFSGRERDISLDGEATTVMLGTDRRRGDALVGIMLLRSGAEGGYAGPEGSGRIETDLSGLVPWAGRRADGAPSLWAAAGAARGGLTLTPEGGEPVRTGLSWSMVAAGAEGPRAALHALGGAKVSWRADATWTRTASGAADGPAGRLAAASAETVRLRLALRAAWQRTLASGATLSPGLEIGLRHDGGDAETGFGIEVGGGARYADPARGLSVSLDARALALHEDRNLDDRGLALAVEWDPHPETRLGPSVIATRGWGGAATGGVSSLLDPATLPGLSDDGGAVRTGLEAAWGTALRRGAVRSAYGRVSGVAGAEEVRLGWRVAPDNGRTDRRSHARDLWIETDHGGEDRTAVGTALKWTGRHAGTRASAGIDLRAGDAGGLQAGLSVALEW